MMKLSALHPVRGLLIAAVAVGLLLTVAAGVARGGFSAGGPAEYYPLPPSSADAGVLLVPHDASGKTTAFVSGDRAESAARDWLGTVTGPSARVIQVSFGDFTDLSLDAVDSATGRVELTARPAFVVTFGDLTIPSRGPGGRVNHEMSVVVDGRTGVYLEAFTVR